MVSEMDYPSVLAAARLGAEWAWTILYRDLSPHVLRYLKAHAAREPEDLLGDVFVQVVRGISAFEGGDRDFRAWVITIARNRLIDDWRRRSRSPEGLALDDLPAGHATQVGDAEADAMLRLGDQRVRSVIERLTPHQRDVLYLRMFVGLTIDEIATVVGKRRGAVKSIQTRALATIRREIAKEAVTL
jgi:RNA polymerase sigma factor (sigma-70 family)